MIRWAIILLVITGSYLIGCFSTARLAARIFRSLRITRVGTGHADTENIYTNVSRPLGIVVGLIDIGKMYLYLFCLGELLQQYCPYCHSEILMLIYGFATIIGHCLPVFYKLRGGRGLFTFVGYFAYFAFWPVVTVLATAPIFVFIFRQIRFVQFMIVLLPPFLTHLYDKVFDLGYPDFGVMFLASFLMGVLNFFVAKQKGEL